MKAVPLDTAGRLTARRARFTRRTATPGVAYDRLADERSFAAIAGFL